MEQAQNLLQAILDFAAWALLQPAAATLVGGFAAGWAIGAAKNRSALGEIVRGVMAGVTAWGVVLLVQAVIGGAA